MERRYLKILGCLACLSLKSAHSYYIDSLYCFIALIAFNWHSMEFAFLLNWMCRMYIVFAVHIVITIDPHVKPRCLLVAPYRPIKMVHLPIAHGSSATRMWVSWDRHGHLCLPDSSGPLIRTFPPAGRCLQSSELGWIIQIKLAIFSIWCWWSAIGVLYFVLTACAQVK